MDPEDVASMQEAFTTIQKLQFTYMATVNCGKMWAQWLISRYEPDYNDHVASPIDLDDYISSWAPATGRDEWDDWQAWEGY